jgi:site-specific DNA recombinase
MKAIIFARVSTKEQMQEGHSIPAQVGKMRQYCAAKGFEIKKEYKIDESSTKEERKRFEEVIVEIENSNEKVALIIETVDRLQRSFKESPVLDELCKRDKLEIHFLREGLIISKNSNSSDIMRWDMGVMFAKSYVLQLRDNVKRSQQQKLLKGEYPAKAPRGYQCVVTDNGQKDNVHDAFFSKVILEVYQLYASQAFSMELLRAKLKKDYGIDWSKGYLDKILKNSFYYGVMKWDDKPYPHRYKPIISKELFDMVQQVKAGFCKKPFKYAGKTYYYRGLLRCADCGLAITPEKHKGHVYYHCTQYNGKHGAQWIREEDITSQLETVFKGMQLPEDVLEDLTNSLKNVHEGKVEYRKEQNDQLLKERELYLGRRERLYMDRLDRRITESEYDNYQQQFQDKINDIEARLALLKNAEDNYYTTAECVLRLAKHAHELFVGSEVEKKRQIVKLTLQNLRLEGKKVVYEAYEPFDLILKCNDRQRWCIREDSNLWPQPPQGCALSS